MTPQKSPCVYRFSEALVCTGNPPMWRLNLETGVHIYEMPTSADGIRCLGNVQRDQAPCRATAYASGGRCCLGYGTSRSTESSTCRGQSRGSDCPDRREVSGLLFGLLAVDDDADHQAAATAATVRASSTFVWIYVVEL